MAFDIRNTGFELPDGWKLLRLGDIAKINSRTLTKKSNLPEIRYIDISSTSTGKFEEPTWMKIEDAPSRAKRILADNDIIISTVRPNLKQFSFIENASANLIASTGFCVISADNEKLAWYLYALMTSDMFTAHLVAVADGAAYPSFNPIEIEDAIIALPPEKYLDAIVDITRAIHKKILLNTQTNQTLEQIAQAIYKSWFVDYEPTRAKAAVLAAGGNKEEAETAAMTAISGKTADALAALKQHDPARYQQLADLAAAFPAALVPTDNFGEIPEGWEIVPFNKVSRCFDNKRIPLSKKQRDERKGNIPYYGATSVIDYVDEPIFNGTYLLIGEDGSVIKDDGTPFAQYIWGESWVNNHAHVLQGYNGISTEELYLFMKQKNISAYITGAVQMKLNQNNMNKITFTKANNKLHVAFQQYIKPIFETIKIFSEQNKNLTKARDYLLPILLKGKPL